MASNEKPAISTKKGVIRIGKEGNDTLFGSAGRDGLYGGPGDDLLIGSPAPDMMYGDAGTDTVDYSGSGTGISVNLASGEMSGGDAAGDRLFGIDRVIATNHGDMLVGGSWRDRLDGGPGADIIRFGRESGRDTVVLDGKATSADGIQLWCGDRLRSALVRAGRDQSGSVGSAYRFDDHVAGLLRHPAAAHHLLAD